MSTPAAFVLSLGIIALIALISVIIVTRSLKQQKK